MKKELRYMPLGEEYMMNKTANDNIYGYLQSISYIDTERRRFVYKSECSASKIQKGIQDARKKEDDAEEISLAKIKRNLSLFKSKSVGLMVEGSVKDVKGKEVKVFFLPINNDEPYKLIPLDTLRFLVNTTNGNVIKIYTYLLHKGFKKGYVFTNKELLLAIGYKDNNSDNYAKINHILTSLKNNGLIDYVRFHETINGKPVPRMRLTMTSLEYKK